MAIDLSKNKQQQNTAPGGGLPTRWGTHDVLEEIGEQGNRGRKPFRVPHTAHSALGGARPMQHVGGATVGLTSEVPQKRPP